MTIKPNSLLNVNPGNPVVREHSLNRGMVGWWLALPHLVGGDTVYDLGGRHHGTLYTNTTYKPVWAGADRPGGLNTVYINGNAQQNIALPTNLSGAFTSNEASFAVWIKKIPNSAAYYAAGLAHLGPDSQVTAWGGAGYNCYFSLFEQLIRPIGPVTPGNPIIDNWCHLVVTTKPGTGNYRLILNGKVYATGDQSSFYLPADPNFAGASASNQEAMAGWADDWRLWNRALSDAEVQQLYQESRAGYPDMLRRKPLYWSVSGSQSYSFDPSGGAAFGGSSTASRSTLISPSGGAAAGGSSAASVAFRPTAGGGLDLGGLAELLGSLTYYPSGGLGLGGSALPAMAFDVAPGGGTRSGGSSSALVANKVSPAGGSTFGGSSSAGVSFEIVPGGGLDLGGLASIGGGVGPFIPSGGWRFGGSVSPAVAYSLAPGGGLRFGGLGAVVPSGPTEIRAALFAKLSEVVACGVNYYSLPQLKPFPAVTYYLASRDYNHALSGPTGLSTAHFRVSAWSRKSEEAAAIAQTIRGALEGFTGRLGAVEVLGIFLTDESDVPDQPRDGTDRSTYQIVLSFDVIHRSS